MNDYGLSGKCALVTGVSRRAGIGAAVAQRRAECGANVFTTYFRPFDREMPWNGDDDEAEGIVADLRAAGVRAGGIEADLADPDTASRIFQAAADTVGPIDILVNNAACDYEVDIQSITADLLDRHYAVNVRGTALLCAEFARRHDGRPGGRIINLTSGQGTGPMPDNLAYAVSKGAVDALTTSLAAGLAGKRITVNAVDPGPTDTGWMSPDLRERITFESPLGRIGTPADAARLIVFLASAEAEWITGQIVRSRGGL